jgi:hypothetical protein
MIVLSGHNGTRRKDEDVTKVSFLLYVRKVGTHDEIREAATYDPKLPVSVHR